MKRSTKLILVFVILIVALAVMIPLIVNAGKIRPLLERQLTAELVRSVKIGDLSLPPFSGRLIARDVSIADDPAFSVTPFLTAKEVRIGVYLTPLIFRREVKLRNFRIESPQITLMGSSDGTWNFSSLGHAASGGESGSSKISLALVPNFSVSRILVENGMVAITTLPAHGEPTLYEHVNFTAYDFSFTSPFSFELDANLPAGGTLSATGQLGPINRNGDAASPCDTQISAKNFDPVAAGFLNPDAGISFLADFDVHAASYGQRLTSEGNVHLQNLKLRKAATAATKPVDLAFAGTHRLKKNSGEIREASIKIGDAAIHLSGTYQIVEMAAKDTDLNLKIAGQSLPVDDLQMLMAASAVRLPNGSVLKGGTLSLDLRVTGQEKSLVIAGPVELDNAKLVGFDVGSKIHGIASLSGVQTGNTTEFEKLRMNVRITNSGVTIDKIHAVIPAMGKLTGSGTISPDDQLDFKLLAIGVKAKGIGKIGVDIMSVISGSSGPSTVPLRVTGTSEEPSITADLGGMWKQTKSPLNKK